jgi:hypothetical protein
MQKESQNRMAVTLSFLVIICHKALIFIKDSSKKELIYGILKFSLVLVLEFVILGFV